MWSTYVGITVLHSGIEKYSRNIKILCFIKKKYDLELLESSQKVQPAAMLVWLEVHPDSSLVGRLPSINVNEW